MAGLSLNFDCRHSLANQSVSSQHLITDIIPTIVVDVIFNLFCVC
jgi:hypothetical protein